MPSVHKDSIFNILSVCHVLLYAPAQTNITTVKPVKSPTIATIINTLLHTTQKYQDASSAMLTCLSALNAATARIVLVVMEVPISSILPMA